MDCKCGTTMVPRPVPGAVRFPQRLECPTHGYPSESRSNFGEHVEDWREGMAETTHGASLDYYENEN